MRFANFQIFRTKEHRRAGRHRHSAPGETGGWRRSVTEPNPWRNWHGCVIIRRLFGARSDPRQTCIALLRCPRGTRQFCLWALIRSGEQTGPCLAHQTESVAGAACRRCVIGRNFTEIAPCTNVRESAGQFHDGVRRGELEAIFSFLFNFKPILSSRDGHHVPTSPPGTFVLTR